MRATRLVLLAMLWALMAGCAGTRGGTISMSSAALASDDVDAEKVATVNQWAQTHGATVVWINYPVRPHPRGGENRGSGD